MLSLFSAKNRNRKGKTEKQRERERGHRWYWNYSSDYSSIDASFEITFPDNSDIDRAVLLLRVSTMRFSITDSEIITSRVTDRATSDIFAQSHFPRFFFFEDSLALVRSFFRAPERVHRCVCVYICIFKNTWSRSKQHGEMRHKKFLTIN